MSATAELQGKLTLKISDFNAALDESEKQHNAATGRMTAAEKKAANEREKIAKREAAEAAKAAKETEAKHKELAGKAKESASTAAHGLASAGNLGDVVGTGFEAIGALGGPIAGAAAAGAVLAKGVYDAAENARMMHKEFTEMARDSSFMDSRSAGFGELLGQAEKIGEKLRQLRMEKDEAKERLGDRLGGLIDGTVANNPFGAVMEKAVGLWQNYHGHMDPAMQRAVDVHHAKEDQSKGYGDAGTFAKEDLAIAEERLKVSEREAAIDEARLVSRRNIAAVSAAMKKGGASDDEVESVAAPMRDSATLVLNELERKGNEVWRGYADEVEDAAERAKAGTVALTDSIAAMRLEVERLQKESAREAKYASGGTEEQNLEHLRKANAANAAQLASKNQIIAAERGLAAARIDSSNAQRQSEITVLGITDRALSSQEQLKLIHKEIADLAERRLKAEQGAKPAIDAQIAGLNAQAAQAQAARNMLTPAQKQAQKLEDRKRAREMAQNERAEKAQEKMHGLSDQDRGKADTAKSKARLQAEEQRRKGGNSAFFGKGEHLVLPRPNLRDSLHRGLDKPANAADDFTAAMDQTQLAKDIRVLATAAGRPAVAG